jgi:hypothetical protein
MKIVLATLFVVVLAVPVVATDLGNRAPAKPASAFTPPPPPDPAVLRQGGDTIAEAVRIPIPTYDLPGTTEGYGDDYDESFPYSYGHAPDVVYSIVPEVDLVLSIDMCGSQYDTRIWVYDTDLNRIAENDDYYYPGHPCGDYVSKIEEMPVEAGAEYFIIVDGYGGDSGEYLIDVFELETCELECPPGAELEGEPPLMDGYVDQFNGGCNTDEYNPALQPLTAPIFCGVSGWYLVGASNDRDTDWLTVEIPVEGVLEINGDAERESYLFELGPQDCGTVGVLQDVIIGECAEGSLTISGEPGTTAWLWVGPNTFYSPYGDYPYSYDYMLWLNLDPVVTEHHSWSEVKALFD